MLQHNPHWPPTQDCDRCDGEGTTDCDQCWEDREHGPFRVHELDAHPCPHCDHGRVPADLDDQHTLHVFDQEHAHTQVWVIEFKLAAVVRLLTPAARPAGSELGYTSNPANALPDEPEVIDPAILRPHWRDDAVRRHADADRDQLRRALRSRNQAA